MWRKILPISKDPFLSKMSFHFILTNRVTGSCAQRSSAELIRNLLVRDYRWASCLANAGLVVSWDFYHVHKSKSSAVSKQALCVSSVTRIYNYYIWIHHCHKCEKYWVKGLEVWGEKKTKRGNRFVLLIWISILIKITGSICNRIWSHK